MLNRSKEYSYTSPEDGGFYVYNTVTVERTSGKALEGHALNKAGPMIGFLSAGVTEKTIELREPIGTQSSLTLLMKNGKPIGNTFTAIVGHTSVLLIYSGIYFETENEFREFIQDKIKKYRT